jgi:hypothetical protein
LSTNWLERYGLDFQANELRRHCAEWLCLLLLVGPLLFASSGCDETLPPRIEPGKFLKASLHVKPNSVVNVFIDSNAVSIPITINGPSGSLELSLKSLFNEVLEEKPFISGTADVWLTSQPTVRTKVIFTEVNVEYPYIEPNGYLTMVPGDSLAMAKQWTHIADNGRGFWNFVQLRNRVDGTGRFYFESAPVRFTAVATVQAFENVPAEKTEPYEFSLVYNIYVRYPP